MPTSELLTFDPAKPAQALERSDSDRLDAIGRLLAAMLETMRPGVPGVEGGQQRDEIEIRAMNIPAGETYPVSGSLHRVVLVIRNQGAGTLYITRRKDQFPVTDGFPLETGAALDVHARGTVYLTADVASCDVRLFEERT